MRDSFPIRQMREHKVITALAIIGLTYAAYTHPVLTEAGEAKVHTLYEQITERFGSNQSGPLYDKLPLSSKADDAVRELATDIDGQTIFCPSESTDKSVQKRYNAAFIDPDSPASANRAEICVDIHGYKKTTSSAKKSVYVYPMVINPEFADKKFSLLKNCQSKKIDGKQLQMVGAMLTDYTRYLLSETSVMPAGETAPVAVVADIAAVSNVSKASQCDSWKKS